ncbi:MAG: hypothetical protein J7493_04995 [Porphyrobacter sp.]|nr:hypothetical protein [Porphyrobacter sp.]
MRALIAVCLLTSLAACQAENSPSQSEETSPPAEAAPSPAATTVTPMVPPVAADTEAEDKCGAVKLDRWLNVLPTDTVKAEITSAVGERVIRYYGPDDALTMDFSEERLNAELGADGRIKRFHCG